jgi:hypothetical protein
LNSTKRLSGRAGSAFGDPGGSSNAMPPARTVARDCALSASPLALSRRSTPLAFQNRACGVTRVWNGASTNTRIAISSIAGSSV